MSELMAASKNRQKRLLEDARRCGMLQAPSRPTLYDRVILELSESLISAGTKLRQQARPRMPVQPVPRP